MRGGGSGAQQYCHPIAVVYVVCRGRSSRRPSMARRRRSPPAVCVSRQLLADLFFSSFFRLRHRASSYCVLRTALCVQCRGPRSPWRTWPPPPSVRVITVFETRDHSGRRSLTNNFLYHGVHVYRRRRRRCRTRIGERHSSGRRRAGPARWLPASAGRQRRRSG